MKNIEKKPYNKNRKGVERFLSYTSNTKHTQFKSKLELKGLLFLFFSTRIKKLRARRKS